MQPQFQSEGGNKMQIQLTTDYAIRILTYLAMKKAVASSTELSIKLEIPQKYVARIGYKLKNANLADTVTGKLKSETLATLLQRKKHVNHSRGKLVI